MAFSMWCILHFLLLRDVSNLVLASCNDLNCLSWLLVNNFYFLHNLECAHSFNYSAKNYVFSVHEAKW
jgi:hypothetical protein